MQEQSPPPLRQSRRSFLGQAARGLGPLALASLLDPAALDAGAAPTQTKKWPGVVNPPHFAPKAKRVIHLYQAGGPSHLETFDFKPELAKLDGKPMPEALTEGQPIAQLQGKQLRVMGAQHPFEKFGESGQEICSIFPQMGAVADEFAIVREDDKALRVEIQTTNRVELLSQVTQQVPYRRPSMLIGLRNDHSSWLVECEILPLKIDPQEIFIEIDFVVEWIDGSREIRHHLFTYLDPTFLDSLFSRSS